MIRRYFRRLTKRLPALVALVTLLAFQTASTIPAWAMSSVRGGALPQPLPLFPTDNWWNLDISSWPVDGNSANYISFINNGGTRRLHPDFGGNDTSTANGIYGFPYAVVTGVTSADLQSVLFQYWDESDGVNLNTGVSFPFYPIPPEAISQARWIEGGDPGNVDRRSSQDRHLLVVDRDRNYLYELYNVFYSASQGKWLAGSGAFFDMNTNNRRPDTWTSADAAGLAILPGLVRYDEVYDPTAEIRHALRVTVRATNGYVYPASHRAGSMVGALPMGARLRLKPGIDITQRTSDLNVQKIFRAMQKYGLIVADNGSDMYISGTYDTRWNNDILNPAFSNLTANDFEVIQLGYNPAPAAPASLSSLGLNPSTVTGGQAVTGSVSLTGPAPSGGALVNLSSANPAATVPSSVTVPFNSASANFTVNTTSVSSATAGNITAVYAAVSKSAILTVNAPAPAALSSLTLNPSSAVGGSTSVGTVTLTKPAPASGAIVALTTNKTVATVPASVNIAPGASSATFNIVTKTTNKKVTVSIGASYGGITKSATLTVVRR
jgi:hypothetical protein